MWFAYNCCINFCQFSPFIYRLCEHISHNTIPILFPLLKLMLHLCPPHPLPTPASHSLACTFYEFVKVCRLPFCGDGSGVGDRCDTALRGILVSKTTEAIVVKFHLKYDQTPGFQNYKG